MAKILKKPITSTIIVIICGFFVAGIVLAVTGYSPVASISALFRGIFGRPKYISNVIIKSTPLILTGLSAAFAFKAGLFNIGAEGQYIMGTIAAVVVGVSVDLPMVLQIPLVLLSATIAGALWGALSGWLKARFGIHEVITTIMLNWVALYLSNYIANNGIFHKPETNGTYLPNASSFIMILPEWKKSDAGIAYLKKHPVLLDILLKTDVNVGILLAVLVCILCWFILKHTTSGYEVRAVGMNEHASRASGISVSKNLILSMLVSGAVAGLAGAIVITGNSPHCINIMSVSDGTGFNGLSVALIANSSPIGCIFAGLLFGGLLYGGQTIQSEVGAPSEIISIMMGTIVFFIALTKIVPVLVQKLEKRGAKA